MAKKSHTPAGPAAAIKRIDAHQHFWKFDPVRDSWITPEMDRIRRDFLPADLYPILQEQEIDGTVLVQCDQSETENEFLLKLAADHHFIRGVVGWVDLQSSGVEERLAYYKGFPKMKGFRHVLQGETDRALMLKPAFKRGIGLLGKFGYAYDILIYPDQLGFARELVAAFPNQAFVIDHIAKPYIREQRLAGEWMKAIREIAQFENVSCKISGMVTEADWENWTPADLRPYMEAVVESFGTKRIFFGSDWPVCLVAASYPEVVGLVFDFMKRFSADEQAAFFSGNASRFYKL